MNTKENNLKNAKKKTLTVLSILTALVFHTYFENCSNCLISNQPKLDTWQWKVKKFSDTNLTDNQAHAQICSTLISSLSIGKKLKSLSFPSHIKYEEVQKIEKSEKYSSLTLFLCVSQDFIFAFHGSCTFRYAKSQS